MLLLVLLGGVKVIGGVAFLFSSLVEGRQIYLGLKDPNQSVVGLCPKEMRGLVISVWIQYPSKYLLGMDGGVW